jgi:hypothetical protein
MSKGQGELFNRRKVVHIYDVERGWSGANEHFTKQIIEFICIIILAFYLRAPTTIFCVVFVVLYTIVL